MRNIFCFCILFVCLLSACDLPARSTEADAPGLSTLVAATLAALTPSPTFTPVPSSTPVPTATPAQGEISGKVCFSEQSVIQLSIYFQNMDTTDEPVIVRVSHPQESYSVDLPNGTYRVYAWSPDYTVAVLPDAGPTLTVNGFALKEVDICDYSDDPALVQYPPGFTPSSEPGSISGRVTGYHGASDAQFTVVVFDQGTGYWYYVILQPGEAEFTFSDMDAGRYQVVVYDGMGAVGGSAANMYVIAGQNTSVGISSWGDGFPENPID